MFLDSGNSLLQSHFIEVEEEMLAKDSNMVTIVDCDYVWCNLRLVDEGTATAKSNVLLDNLSRRHLLI